MLCNSNTYSVLVRLGGVNIVNSPGSVVVSAGVAAAANTAITTPAGGVPAATTNNAVSTFTITVRHTYARVLYVLTVLFTVDWINGCQ